MIPADLQHRFAARGKFGSLPSRRSRSSVRSVITSVSLATKCGSFKRNYIDHCATERAALGVYAFHQWQYAPGGFAAVTVE